MLTSDDCKNDGTNLLGDLRILLLLYVTFRLVMLMAYQPVLLEDGEVGIGAGGDRLYQYRLAALSEKGWLPFRDWWSEFPPIWYATTSTIYLLLGETVNYTNWSFLVGLLMLACEAGNLAVVRGDWKHALRRRPCDGFDLGICADGGTGNLYVVELRRDDEFLLFSLAFICC